MKKIKNTEVNTEDQAKEYLQKVSQCIYNLRKIIDAHLSEPIDEDKDLDKFYWDEMEKLQILISNPVGSPVVLPNIKLSPSLMFNRGKTTQAKRELDNADDFIRLSLGMIQRMRRQYYGSSIPTQGLESGSLKDYLVDFLDKKRKERNPEDNEPAITKKKMTLPNFPRTEWARVSIKFIDDTNALLSNSKETKPLVPESLGCIDNRTKKADMAWAFLLRVAKGQGVTPSIVKSERETQKKQKQKITDILRNIFKNDTDPFHKEKGGIYRAKFIINYPEEEIKDVSIDKKYSDLEGFLSETTESTQEDIQYDARQNINPGESGEFSQ